MSCYYVIKIVNIGQTKTLLDLENQNLANSQTQLRHLKQQKISQTHSKKPQNSWQNPNIGLEIKSEID